jgi:chemotaxis signal transduction protein
MIHAKEYTQDHNSLLTFMLCGEEYAVNTNSIECILPLASVEHRETHGYRKRNDVLDALDSATVVNLHSCLGKNLETSNPTYSFIVVNLYEKKIAVIVDQIKDLVCLGERELETNLPGRVHTEGYATVMDVEIGKKKYKLLNIEQILGAMKGSGQQEELNQR